MLVLGVRPCDDRLIVKVQRSLQVSWHKLHDRCPDFRPPQTRLGMFLNLVSRDRPKRLAFMIQLELLALESVWSPKLTMCLVEKVFFVVESLEETVCVSEVIFLALLLQ